MNSSSAFVLSRRRFLTIAVGSAAIASLHTPAAMATSSPSLYEWRGMALGADARLLLEEDDQQKAENISRECFDQLKKLEAIFSLYDPNSCVSQLNRNGTLLNPPAELLEVLELARYVSEQTNGTFDVTVQPLWQGILKQETTEKLATLQSKVNYHHLHFSDKQVRFTEPGMAITLNGIAQGYITDRMVQLLKEAGIGNAFVDMGEIYAMGHKSNTQPWQTAIRHPDIPHRFILRLPLTDKALATSGGYGTAITPTTHHLLNAKTGKQALHYKSLSVTAENAAIADAWSTALYLLPPQEMKTLAKANRLDITVLTARGETHRYS